MTRNDALRFTDLVFKILVPLLLMTLGIIGNSINNRLSELSGDVKVLRDELHEQVGEIHVEQAIIKEQLKNIKGG